MFRRAGWFGWVLIATAVVARPVRAQRDSTQAQLGVDRVGSYLSYTTVEHGRNGWELGADLDLGSVIRPALHVVAEANYLHADFAHRNVGGVPLEGSFHDFSVGAAARLTVIRIARFEPYVGAGIGVHFLGTDIAK